MEIVHQIPQESQLLTVNPLITVQIREDFLSSYLLNKSLSTNGGLPAGSRQSGVSRVLICFGGLLRQLNNSAQRPVAPFRISGSQDAICRARSTRVLNKTNAAKQN